MKVSVFKNGAPGRGWWSGLKKRNPVIAAEAFKVPKSTISDKIRGRSDLESNIGRPPSLPKSIEGKIVENVIEASRRGMGISRRQLLQRTAQLCKRMKVSVFKNGAPGRGWWSGLKKRNPVIAIRKPEKLGNSRARMTNPTVVQNHMTDLGKKNC
jgi:ABC-type arginine transport system ATPase subunit